MRETQRNHPEDESPFRRMFGNDFARRNHHFKSYEDIDGDIIVNHIKLVLENKGFCGVHLNLDILPEHYFVLIANDISNKYQQSSVTIIDSFSAESTERNIDMFEFDLDDLKELIVENDPREKLYKFNTLFMSNEILYPGTWRCQYISID